MKLISFSLALTTVAMAADLYVAPDGSDGNPGSKDKPFGTLEHVRDAARGQSNVTVRVRGGTYVLNKTFVLTPEDSGVTYRAFAGEKPVLTGGRQIAGWRPLTGAPGGAAAAASGRLWVADVPKGWCFHYLYVDGAPLPRAKLLNTHWRTWPTDFTHGAPTKNGQPVTFKNKAILQNLPANGDVEMVCIMAQYGVMGNGVLTQINPATGTAVWNSNQTHLGFRTRDPNRYTLENALPFIDEPGEWCVDSAAGRVYCWPRAGAPLTTAVVMAPVLHRLISIEGDAANQKVVENITVTGLTMVGTDRLPENQWPDSWIVRQWEHPDAMIFMQGARNCAITDCRLLHSGATGITLNQFCQGIRIAGNEIGWPGSDGILLCGDGPGTRDVNGSNLVTRNWIHDMGQGNYWHSNALQIYQSGHNTITLNLLQRSAYSCISIVGVGYGFMQSPNCFFRDNPADADRQFKMWSMFGIRSQDFPKAIQDGVRAGTYRFNRETIKPYTHSNGNLIENNIVVQPEQLLDEGGAIYAWGSGKGNIWKDNLVFKSSGMPGSSVLALDDLAEYFTVIGNVVWVNGVARCGTIGMRPTERGNVIHGNVRASVPDQKAVGCRAAWCTFDPTRDSVYNLEKTIMDKGKAAGGWLGNPDPGIPRPGEEIKDAVQRTLPKGSHLTIE